MIKKLDQMIDAVFTGNMTTWLKALTISKA